MKNGILRQLPVISWTKVKPPAEWSIAPSVRSSEPGTSRTNTKSNDKNGRAPPVTDSLMEPSLEALISSPHRYTLRSVAGTVISYATSHTPSDMPLYTRTETRSIPSLPEPRVNIRASAVITERPGGTDEVIKSLPHPPTSRPRKPYPWSSHRLILEPPVIPDAGVKTSVKPTTSLSPSPFPRRCHALLATGTETGDLFIFGGLVDKTARNDLYRFSTRDLSATLLHTRGETPSPRVGHVSALASGVLIVWGGNTNMFPKSKPTEKHDNDLHLLDIGVYLNFSCASFNGNLTRPTVSQQWTCVPADGPCPVGRYGHAATVAEARLFVFGGQVDGEYLNDLWALDLNSRKFSFGSLYVSVLNLG